MINKKAINKCHKIIFVSCLGTFADPTRVNSGYMKKIILVNITLISHFGELGKNTQIMILILRIMTATFYK